MQGEVMLISRWTRLTASQRQRARCSAEVNLANTLELCRRRLQMDENQTNWKPFSIAAQRDCLIRQMNFILPGRPLANRLSFVGVR